MTGSDKHKVERELFIAKLIEKNPEYREVMGVLGRFFEKYVEWCEDRTDLDLIKEQSVGGDLKIKHIKRVELENDIPQLTRAVSDLELDIAMKLETGKDNAADIRRETIVQTLQDTIHEVMPSLQRPGVTQGFSQIG